MAHDLDFNREEPFPYTFYMEQIDKKLESDYPNLCTSSEKHLLKQFDIDVIPHGDEPISEERKQVIDTLASYINAKRKENCNVVNSNKNNDKRKTKRIRSITVGGKQKRIKRKKTKKTNKTNTKKIDENKRKK